MRTSIKSRVAKAAAALSLAVAIWSVLVGGVTIKAFGVQIFRTGGLYRPALAGVLLLALAGRRRAALWVATTIAALNSPRSRRPGRSIASTSVPAMMLAFNSSAIAAAGLSASSAARLPEAKAFDSIGLE